MAVADNELTVDDSIENYLRNLVTSKQVEETVDLLFANTETNVGEKEETINRVTELLKVFDECEDISDAVLTDVLVVLLFEMNPHLDGDDDSPIQSVLDFFASPSVNVSTKHLVIELIFTTLGIWSFDEPKKVEKAIGLLDGFLLIPTRANFLFIIREQSKDISRISKGSDVVSEGIYKGAKFIESGLANVVTPFLTNSIKAVGSFAKDSIEPTNGGEIDAGGDHNENESDEAISVSDNVVYATDKFRQGSQFVASGVQNVSAKGIDSIRKKWEENDYSDRLVKDKETKELLSAAGKVCIAAIGATAVVGESIFETTKEVSRTGVKVASEVATHSHGDKVGKQVENIGGATVNVFEGITYIGTLERKVLAKQAAKKAAKVQMDGKISPSNQ